MNLLTAFLLLDMVTTCPKSTLQCLPPHDESPTPEIEIPAPKKGEKKRYTKYTRRIDPSIIYAQLEGDDDKWEQALKKVRPCDSLDDSYLQF